MDNFPIEYRDRMLAEQMVMMEALQLIALILICFVLLVAFVVLVVNLNGIVRTRLSERRPSDYRQSPHPRRKAARLCDPAGGFENKLLLGKGAEVSELDR